MIKRMPTVYLAAQRGHPRTIRKFHATPQCRQLRKKPARGTPHDTEAIELKLLSKVVPCKTCFPNAPRPGMSRRYCPKCNKRTARACAHNGGVPVWVTGTTSYTSLLRDPGDQFNKMIYVWPDRAHLYYSTA